MFPARRGRRTSTKRVSGAGGPVLGSGVEGIGQVDDALGERAQPILPRRRGCDALLDLCPQFDRDAAAVKDCAKPIMIAVLNYAGMRIDDVPNWTVSAATLTSSIRELAAMAFS